jgi:cell division inhibitor SepF
VPSFFQKTMLYLGLAPEEEYDDLEHVDPYTDPQSGASERRPQPPQRQQEYAPQAVSHQPKHQTAPPPSHSEAEPGAVRTISREQAVAAGGKVSPIAASPPPLPSASVRTFAMSSVKPHVVAPRQFNEAQTIADHFKSDQPVILNLQEVDRDLRRRLIDFASGLSYGLGGRMDRVADGVYLLTPENVEVSDEERRRLQERGLHH